ncbi:MerC domain-containing protein [Marixanthomonas sp. SCSIO 43207]|uniref:MerC domain-containing protein n=1 Tax=Marixanthomonas sp. SCSIO 43207 TaxID=2779360 RepID=UPI002103CEFB|nr:MerC domain-containing protein [Marixanthomonas sp. SCSIO 43207]
MFLKKTMLVNLHSNSNILGSIASGLCLIHCIITPLLFVAHAGHIHEHHAHAHPFWWGLIDLLFIAISLLAVYWSAKNTSKKWLRYALWISWFALSFVIFNEKLSFLSLAEEVIYIPAIALILFHLLNRKYCECSDDTCCVKTNE